MSSTPSVRLVRAFDIQPGWVWNGRIITGTRALEEYDFSAISLRFVGAGLPPRPLSTKRWYILIEEDGQRPRLMGEWPDTPTEDAEALFRAWDRKTDQEKLPPKKRQSKSDLTTEEIFQLQREANARMLQRQQEHDAKLEAKAREARQ